MHTAPKVKSPDRARQRPGRGQFIRAQWWKHHAAPIETNPQRGSNKNPSWLPDRLQKVRARGKWATDAKCQIKSPGARAKSSFGRNKPIQSERSAGVNGRALPSRFIASKIRALVCRPGISYRLAGASSLHIEDFRWSEPLLLFGLRPYAACY